MPFTTIKSYTTQAAESGAPAAGYANFKTIDGLTKNARITRLMELRLDTPVLVGAPTAVIFDLYRFNSATNSVDFLFTWAVLATDITAGKVPPVVIETWGNEVMTKVSFSGGTAPTFTGSVMGRALE